MAERETILGSRNNDFEYSTSDVEENNRGNEVYFVEFSEIDYSILHYQEYEYQRGSGWPSGILIMANICLGMGILNFPRIFYETGGILPTLLILAIFVIFIAGSLFIIGYCCKYYACVNYQDMVRVHCGRHFGIVCSVTLFFELTGSLIVKMVVLADQINIFHTIILGETQKKNIYFMPIVAILIFLPMCFIKNFSCFKYVSIGGIFAALYITFGVAVVGYYTSDKLNPEYFKENKEQQRNFNLIIPLLVYGYHGHVEAPLVFSAIKKQKLHNFMKTVYCYLFISTACYVITGLYGYLTFGRNAKHDFLCNYNYTQRFANVAVLIVSFKLSTSFPVVFFVVRSVFSGFYSHLVDKIPQQRFKDFLANYSVARVLQTLFIFFFVIVLATLFPNISNAISLIAAISCHFCFTFPGLCFFCLYHESTYSNRKHFLRKISGIFYIALGMFCFGVTFTVSIQKLISEKTDI